MMDVLIGILVVLSIILCAGSIWVCINLIREVNRHSEKD
jgi:hypothetical protein